MPAHSPRDSSLPYHHGSPLGSAGFRCATADFQVTEVLGFDPSGHGEHCLVWVEKTGHTTGEVMTHFAERLGIRRRLISHCGMKDKDAITRQWFSIHLPGIDSPEADILEAPEIQVLEITRNLRKLHRGTHDANRFTIRLRQPDFSIEAAIERWDVICKEGVPNFFGEQRFGRDGDNVNQARRLFSGELKIRDRLVRGILISAARSHIFNAVVARRLRDGSWNCPLDGEAFGFEDNRSLILPEKLRGDEGERFSSGTIELTAPLWGEGEPLSAGSVAALEHDVAKQCVDLCDGLTAFGLRQERRVIRLRPTESSLQPVDGDFVLDFTLPKGTFATTVLRELFQAEKRPSSSSPA